MDHYTFLSHVFQDLAPGELPLIASSEEGWRARWPDEAFRHARAPHGYYFSIAAHKPVDGEFRRGMRFYSSNHCIVLDDIGTKAAPPPVPPAWVMQTRPGNTQWGYLVERTTEPVEPLLRACAQAGYTDAGAVDAVHLFRLPGTRKGQNIARLTRVDMEVRRPVETLAKLLGLPPLAPMPRRATPAPPSPEEVENDPIAQWLYETKRVRRRTHSGWLQVQCPWHDQHTTRDDEAGYLPGAAAFRCFHEHCRLQDGQDYRQWWMHARDK